MSTTAADFGSVTATVTSRATEAPGVPCLKRDELSFPDGCVADSRQARLRQPALFDGQSKANPRGALVKGMGWPFHDIGDFVNRAGWVNGTMNFKDVWFRTSLQSQSGT